MAVVTGTTKSEKLTGTALADTITGGGGNDRITGLAGIDTITGGAGKDIIDGGAGADAMDGAAGNDLYYVDDAGDTVTDAAGIEDTIRSSITFDLSGAAILAGTIENLMLTGTGNIDATGNAVANHIIGNSGDNVIDGGAGADYMAGGAGNDTYTVDDAGDTIRDEGRHDGTADILNVGINYTLHSSAAIETINLTGVGNISFTGSHSDNHIIGNAGNNVIDGGSGDDLIDGGAGNDTMTGGSGDDTFVVDAAGDILATTGTSGHDLVQSAVTFTLGKGYEDLTLTGAGNINATGNDSKNVITGNTGDNVINAAGGKDTVTGGDGTDTINGGDGKDTLSGGNDADTIDGGDGKDTIDGGADDDFITGGFGRDTITGGLGADTFHFGDAKSSSIDHITDFTVAQTDVLDISDVLDTATVITAGNIGTFLHFEKHGADTYVQLNADGLGTHFTHLATLEGVDLTGQEAALFTSLQIAV